MKGCEPKMKKQISNIGTGIFCSFSAMGAALVLLSAFDPNDSLYLMFPAFHSWMLRSNADFPAVCLAMLALFAGYGIIGGLIHTVCKSERFSLLRQCVISAFLTYLALFATAWISDKFAYSWWITVGCAVCFALIWLLRVWRWKSRVAEIGLALPNTPEGGKRRIWNTAVSRFAATALLWMLAGGCGLVVLLMLCL